MSRPAVCLIYGLGEGPWQGKRFRQALQQCGLVVETDSTKADIIIAHSGGCFYLPDETRSRLTVLINPPFWPGKSTALAMLQKIWLDARDCLKRGEIRFWLAKTFWNTIYLLGNPRKVIFITLHTRKHKFYHALRDKNILIIRNHSDAWLTPDAAMILHKQADFIYRELPGQHDDCWLHPSPYIKVIQSVI